MGNYRFRLSDMMPNAWFYKLKDMGKPRNPNISNSLNKRHLTITSPIPPSHHQNHPNLSLPRNSSNLSHKATQFLDSPSKTRTKRRRRRKTSSKTTTCTCHAALHSVPKPDSPPSHKPVFSVSSYPTNPSDGISSWSSSSSPTTDIIIDLNRQNSGSTTTKRYEKSSTYIDAKRTFSNVRCEKFNSYIDTKSSVSNHKYEKFDEFSNIKSDCGHQKLEKFNGLESISELKLPPILTKPPKHDDLVLEFSEKGREPQRGIRSSTRNAYTSISVKDDSSPVRRLSSLTTQGLKIRTNSPRLASKKIQAYHRKSSSTSPVSSIKTRKKRVTESLVVVKSSFDPQRDFRDSMMEMIIENNIRTSKDLEELLACYLSLNSDEYHGMIVKVFEQIWFDLTEI